MTTADDRATVADILEATDIAVLTYQSLTGALVSTPMGMQDFADPGTIWFITERSSDKVKALETDPRVNVSCSSKKGWVSLSGTAHVSDDRATLKELWDASAGAFMSGGPEDPQKRAAPDRRRHRGVLGEPGQAGDRRPDGQGPRHRR